MGQLFAPLVHHIRDPMQQRGPVEGAERSHGRARSVRRLDGTAGVGPRAFGQLGDHLAARRAPRLEGFAALRVDPPAVDEHLERFDFVRDFHSSSSC